MLPFPPRPLGAHHVQQLTLCAALFASSFILLILSVLSPFQPFNRSTFQLFNLSTCPTSREAALVALRNAAETPSADEAALARALQKDLRPVAERLWALLEEEGDFAAACKRLRKELPDLLREIGQEESAFAKALEGILGAGGAARSDEGRETSDERGKEKLVFRLINS